MDETDLPIATSQVIDQQLDRLAEAIVSQQYELQPELAVKYGPAGHLKCMQDARYHLSYLSQAVRVASPALFSDYIAWAKVMLAGRNIPAEDLALNLRCMQAGLRQHLSSEMGKLAGEYIELALQRLPRVPVKPESFLVANEPLSELAEAYLNALLHYDRQQASKLITGAITSGTPIKDVYLHVFQCTQYEIGRRWQMNQLSVAQEHYCTAATQFIMGQLYPYIFTGKKLGRRMVAASVSGELHEIGIRIVADFFEMEGWDTYYLGANTPVAGIVQTLAERQADVLALSATMTFHVQAVSDMIKTVRASEAGKNVKIIVGGYPFNIEPGLWQQIHADGSAPDADSTVDLATRLVTRSNHGTQ